MEQPQPEQPEQPEEGESEQEGDEGKQEEQAVTQAPIGSGLAFQVRANDQLTQYLICIITFYLPAQDVPDLLKYNDLTFDELRLAVLDTVQETIQLRKDRDRTLIRLETLEEQHRASTLRADRLQSQLRNLRRRFRLRISALVSLLI